MGHTLVTKIEDADLYRISRLFEENNRKNNKIPYGRDCDREAANQILPYHITVFHWAKTEDEKYLNLLKNFESCPCQVEVTGCSVMYAEENSRLLYFSVEPAAGYRDMVGQLERQLYCRTSSFLHMTFAVSKDAEYIDSLEQMVNRKVTFPFPLHIVGLDLYHIWKPVKYIGTF